jgi:outer membrane protein assembly factor BamB
VLPGDVLIADSHANRIILVNPQKQIIWQYPKPGQVSQLHDDDDVFFGPHFDEIITNQEGYNVISILNFRTGKVVWNYGHPGVPGNLPGYLNTPDDAFLYQTPHGDVITVADIKNQRILFINRATRAIVKQYGETGVQVANPPTTFNAPNGDFPAPHGGLLVTQIGANDAVLLNRQGQVEWTVHFPSQFYYPSDANFTPNGNIIVAFYTNPGAVVEMTPQGRVVWEYDVTHGPGMLNHPSLAVMMKNGLVLLNDDYNDRVIVINPRTNKIVWQYGHTGVPGTQPGYLDIPDGLDLLPPGVVPGGHNGVGGHLWSYSDNGL